MADPIPMPAPTDAADGGAEVLYNHACPICRAEITHYARHAEAEGLAIGFRDLNACDLADWGLTPEAAAQRLHLRADGQVLAGVPAFVALWSRMPRYRWLARLIGLPGIRVAAGLIYDRLLAPALYRAHLRRSRNKGSGGGR